MQLTRNAFAFEVKSVDEIGTFEGYGSVFGVLDSHYDIVAKGAFKKSIKSEKPAMLWQHRPDTPIGVYSDIKEDDRGLYVKGQINLDVQAGREAYSLLKQGAIKGMSIGYNARKWSTDNKKGVRTLEEIDLWEISLVTFPANVEATITNVKDDVLTDTGNGWQAKKSIQDLDRLHGALNRALTIIRG